MQQQKVLFLGIVHIIANEIRPTVVSLRLFFAAPPRREKKVMDAERTEEGKVIHIFVGRFNEDGDDDDDEKEGTPKAEPRKMEKRVPGIVISEYKYR